MFGPPKPLSEIMFNKFDKDKSGSIDAKEFQQLTFALGYALSPAEIGVALKILDHDGSGHVEAKEFTAWWKKTDRWEELKLDGPGLEVRQAAAETFNQFDSGKTGKLATTDFDLFHKELTEKKLTTRDKATCLADLDQNRDGAVQFNEYIDWLVRLGTIKVKVIAEANTGASIAPIACQVTSCTC